MTVVRVYTVVSKNPLFKSTVHQYESDSLLINVKQDIEYRTKLLNLLNLNYSINYLHHIKQKPY